MRRIPRVLPLLLLLWFIGPAISRAEELVEPAKIDTLARPLIDEGWAFGMTIGLIDQRGTQIAGYGRMSESDATTPDANTLFEIGSVSKTFTGLLLAMLAEDGKVKLDDPVQKLLGDSMKMPQGEREITLVDLATHSSGLPPLPRNFAPKDPRNPYADYTVKQLGDFLSGYKVKRSPGERYEYSNLGMGLLGHALATKGGASYEHLVRKRICEPLGMNDTGITLSDDQLKRLAQGHDSDGAAVSNWDIPTLAGAGAIRSTAADMLKYLAANMGLKRTPLDAALKASHEVHFKIPDSGSDMALGWHVQRQPRFVMHGGQTGGYSSYVVFSPEKQVGVVVFMTSTGGPHSQIGNELLKLLMTGKAQPVKLPETLQLAEEDLERLTGDYVASLVAKFSVTRDGNQLWVQLTGQPKAKVYPTSKTKVYYRVVDATIDFELDDAGQAKKLVLHQNGQDVPALRKAAPAKQAGAQESAVK